MKEGKFIVIEGVDGTGKSTLAKQLNDQLEVMGITTHLTHEPTDRYRKQALDALRADDQETALELFIKDREVHVREEIVPMLHNGAVVICDRFHWSTAAYQGLDWMQQSAESMGKIMAIIRRHEMATWWVQPDLMVLLDESTMTLEKRLDKRGEKDLPCGQDKAKRAMYLERMSAAYSTLANRHHGDVLRVNGHTPEEKAERLVWYLQAFHGLHVDSSTTAQEVHKQLERWFGVVEFERMNRLAVHEAPGGPCQVLQKAPLRLNHISCYLSDREMEEMHQFMGQHKLTLHQAIRQLVIQGLASDTNNTPF